MQNRKRGMGASVTEVEVPPAESRPSSATSRNGGEVKDEGQLRRNDSFTKFGILPRHPALTKVPGPATSDELENRTTIRSINSDLPVRPSDKISSRKSTDLHDASLASEYNPAMMAYATDGHLKSQQPTLKRRSTSSATIFENSKLAPVTIIITSPEEEGPPSPPLWAPSPYNTFNEIRRSRSGSTTSLPSTRHSPSMSNESLSLPDPNRLMPPTEQQIDARRLQKAREFREIRKFIIQFMNMKGSQFPKKLRYRMMEAYSIADSDLSPETVAKFNDLEIKDEGVELEQLGMQDEGKEHSDAENLRILEMAFRSQIPVVTPKRDVLGGVDAVPPYRARIGQRLNTIQNPRRASTGRPLSQVVDDEDIPLGWLAPMITSSSSTTDLSSMKQEHGIKKSDSTPNFQRTLERTAPPEPPVPDGLAVAGRRRNTGELSSMPLENKLRIVESQTRIKRSGIISGAFGSVREAMRGSSKSRKLMAKEGR
jgi:hypothetical protein